MFQQKFDKLVSEACNYLQGSCEPIAFIPNVFEEQLVELCNKHRCSPDTWPPKYEHYLSMLKDSFQDAVEAEMVRQEYFCCDQCDWWCEVNEEAEGEHDCGRICQDCAGENGEDE